MRNDCRFCLEALGEAAMQIYRCISDSTIPVTRQEAEYLKAYARLCHRLDNAEGHTAEGRLLEKMLDSHGTWGLEEADDVEADDPIEYPEEVQAILSVIDARADNDDSHA